MVAWRRTLLGWVLLTLPAYAPYVAADEGARKLPLVAVVALNDGTEVTDFLVPFGTLAGADVADVVAVAAEAGPVQMLPAVRLSIATTLDSFDRDHAGGADYVIVPAVHRSDDERLIGWLRRQAALGATVVGICDGVWVLARAGLLDGRTATGHWYSLPSLRRTFPGVHWVEGRRFVRDGRVMTTTGVTASLPASVALVGMLGGDAAAARAAERLGVAGADPTHDSGMFRLSPRHVWTGATNALLFWRWETVGVPVRDGIDEVALALTADPLGRTYRTTVVTIADTPGAVRTRYGLTVLADAGAGARTVDRVQSPDADPPAAALDRTLGTIDGAYGIATADLVRLQLEYPGARPASARTR